MDLLRSLFKPGGKTAEERKWEKLERKYGLQSGSSAKSDGSVVAGWATLKGKRPLNEDRTYCTFESSEGVEAGCFGVFDGHGGPTAAEFVRNHLFANLLGHHMFHKNLIKAMEDAYVETDQQYIEEDTVHKRDDGCTAVTVVVLEDRLVIAHVGDSRAVMADGDTAIALSDDHKPNRTDERERIEGAGGAVVWAGTWRVSGVLAVSRSFGNRLMKQFIIPHPEIREVMLQPGITCLVLATDGMWDVMGNGEALYLAQQHTDAEAAARALVAESYARHSQDNISVVVVFFRGRAA